MTAPADTAQARDVGHIRVAFFDVDETLLTVKSMFRFLRFHLRARGLPDTAYEEAAQTLRRRSAAGVPRAQTNREYYRLYAGQSLTDVFAQGRAWFAEELERGILHAPGVTQLQTHQDDGAHIVLVSGSFAPALQPAARLLGADQLICSTPEVSRGKYTGRLARPLIAEEKGRAVQRLLAELDVPAEQAAAYGDHASDLPMLAAAGLPGCVGDDPDLVAHVRDRDGILIPGMNG
ncbi:MULTISPECIES: HAD family hydrolase [unclassified Streptomyces]|uniref:HAD family hydrolase n=1 Tax=unclassified Streptomyces TaxID=2593676 RepID=UPI002E16F098